MKSMSIRGLQKFDVKNLKVGQKPLKMDKKCHFLAEIGSKS